MGVSHEQVKGDMYDDDFFDDKESKEADYYHQMRKNTG